MAPVESTSITRWHQSSVLYTLPINTKCVRWQQTLPSILKRGLRSSGFTHTKHTHTWTSKCPMLKDNLATYPLRKSSPPNFWYISGEPVVGWCTLIVTVTGRPSWSSATELLYQSPINRSYHRNLYGYHWLCVCRKAYKHWHAYTKEGLYSGDIPTPARVVYGATTTTP